MTELAFVLLYGLSLIGGLFMSAVWGRVALKGLRAPHAPGEPRLDMFCLIAIGLCFGAVGNVLVFGWRTALGLRYGVDPSITQQPGVSIILAGLLCFAISKGVLMWAVDTSHHSKGWRAFALLSVLWITLAPLWVLNH